jgi:hypothetical protein
MRAAVALVAFALGCARSPDASRAGAVTPAAADAGDAARAMDARADARATDARADGAAAATEGVDGAYRGTVGALDVLARLELGAGDALRGRYFYVKVGRDIPLDGVRRGADVTLREHVGGKETGLFSGQLEGDALVGTWSAAGKALAFRLTKIPRTPLQPILVASKDASQHVRLADAGPFGGTECTADIRYPELFGLPDAKVEATLNRKLFSDGGQCDEAGQHVQGFSVQLNRDGVLSLALSESGNREGAAHPYAGVSSLNVVTATGRVVTWRDVLAPGREGALVAALEPKIARAVAETAGAEIDGAELLRGVLTPPYADFVLADRGIHVNAFGALPHAVQALGAAEDFFVPYDRLRSSLVTKGDVARVWTAQANDAGR